MPSGKKSLYAILLAGLWINASEFFRNEVLVKSLWTGHFQSLGLTFPSAPLNGALWMLWGFVFAMVVLAISRRASLLQTTFVLWLITFPLMWLVLWNLSVLPVGILPYAVPLSLLEVLVATLICRKVAPPAI